MNYRDNLKEKKFSIFICPSTNKKSHTHSFLELAYVLKGEAVHNWDGSSMHIKEGDYFVIDYLSEHSYHAKTEEFELINCLFLPELIDASLINCRSLQAVISSYQIHFKNEFFTASPAMSIYKDDDGKIKNLLLAILEEFNGEAPGYLQIIRSRIIEILVMTMRKIYFDPKPDKSDSSMNGILKYISSEYMKDITLKDICHKFSYSFSYLSMKFKRELGMSYMEYLQKTRVEQSMRLLVYTDKSVNEIAQTVGYRDIKSFYNVFKRYADTTPAKFRKNYYADL